MGKEKARQLTADESARNRERSMNFGGKDFEKVMKHVNRDYHQASKEQLLHQTDEFRPWSATYDSGVVGGVAVLQQGGQGNPRTNGPCKIFLNT